MELREDRPATIEEHRALRAELRELHGRLGKVRTALLMGVQLAESSGHRATDPQPACPTCHFLRAAKEALRGWQWVGSRPG